MARTKETTKEKAAQEALDKKKAELEAMFDLDRINLQAALSRKLTGEDELRVKILQQLADGTKKAVDEAQRYADVLKVIEDGKITTGEIDSLAQKWGISTKEVELYLRKLFESNEELRKMLALLDEISKKKISNAIQQVQTTVQRIETFQYNTALSSVRGLNADIGGFLSQFNIPKMAEGGVVTQPTLALIGEAGSEAVVPLDRMGGMGTKVIVNVAGSVISEGQLQSVIQDALYNLNRSGAVTQLTNLGR